MPARRQSATGDDPSPSASDSRGRGKEGGKEKETFGCPYPGCGQSYSRMEYLKRHQRKHQDVRPFQCKDCAKSFARSDVLLRHRRRCHPTPPPADRSSRSPAPMHRSYPSVPISSSRTDAREASPSSRDRKHARQSSPNEQDGQPPIRRKVNEEEEDDFEERYGEGSRFRQNGMGNGGVYDISNYYGTSDSTYTPHLLPMFQHAPTYANNRNYHSQDDPTHLEDASALLSIAYGAGSQEGQSSTQPTATNDAASAQNLYMMMDGSAGVKAEANTTGNEDASLNEATGNFLAAMNWLGAGKTGTATSEGAETWPTGNTKATSPFSLSPFFSPSAFSNTVYEDASNTGIPIATGENNEDTSQAVMYILNQLAQYEVPQTKANPNPERPLLRLDHQALVARAGPEIAKDSRFHLPADRFGGCYQVPHWALPPLKVMSLMANRTFDTVLNHFSFLHGPTFKLIDTAACLAFAICTVGGIQSGRHKYDYLLDRVDAVSHSSKSSGLDGPVPPGSTWESMYRNNFSPGGLDHDDVEQVAMWQNGHIVRAEKTNMLVKSFSLAQGVLMTDYNVSLLQALVLYNAPYFLSEDENQRAVANLFLGTIVSVARQIGFFTREQEHFTTRINFPDGEHTTNELDLHWRRWIQLETRRRTAYLVYHLDTVSAIESNIPCILSPCEISLLPLPAPDALWNAPTAEEWLKAVRNYQPMTLDEAMRRTFFLPTFGAFDELHEKADTKYYNLLNQTELGPFARVVLVVTLLRGVIDIGEGKRDRGDWRDLTDLWLNCNWLRPGKKMLDSRGNDLGEVTEASLRDRFAAGLERWRQGWDFDPTCPNPVSGGSSISNASPDSSTSPQSGGSSGSEKKLNYCEEALPYYWLAVALINILKQTPSHEPGWNVFAPGPSNNMQGIKYGEMLKSARLFTRMGEGTAGTHTPCIGSNWTSGTSSGPATVSTSTGLESTLAPSSVETSASSGDLTSDAMFDGIALEDFLGGFGSAADVLAN